MLSYLHVKSSSLQMTFWRTRARLPPSVVVPHPETVQMVPSAYLVTMKIKIKIKMI